MDRLAGRALLAVSAVFATLAAVAWAIPAPLDPWASSDSGELAAQADPALILAAVSLYMGRWGLWIPALLSLILGVVLARREGRAAWPVRALIVAAPSVVGALVGAVVLTPPDVLSAVLWAVANLVLAVPIALLVFALTSRLTR